MKNLNTNYLGLKLNSPVIVGACNLSKNLDNVKAAEESGAGALVYKSLFEEQVHLESIQLQDDLMEYNDRHAEMVTLFPEIKHAGAEEHLHELRTVKESTSLPVIGSLNAIYKETWVEYAQAIEETGVDALELNFYSVPRDASITEDEIVKKQVEIVKAVKAKVKIPVSVKLSPYYANPLNVIKRLDEAKPDGFILFNRFFQPDIDIESEKHFTPFNLSSEYDDQLSLRFSGLLYNQVKGDIIASSGIFSGADVIKMILAGANNVQVVSTLYKNKITHLKTIIDDISKWMDKKGYNSLEDFRGKLSKENVNNPYLYKRAQYIDLLLNPEGVLKKYKLS